MLFENIVDAIGYTPLVKINGLDADSADIYVKLEKNNPSGSVKDRPVKYIVQDLLDQLTTLDTHWFWHHDHDIDT